LSEKRLFLKNTAFNAAFNIFSQIINLLILPLFIKNLGTGLYGIWVLSTLIIGYMGLMNFGFGAGIQKYLSRAYNLKEETKFNEYISTGVFIYLIVGVLIFLITIFYSDKVIHFFHIDPQNQEAAKSLLLISGAYSIVFWPITMLDSIFPAILNYKISSLLRGLQITGSSIGLLILVYLNLNIVQIAAYDKIIRFFLWLPTIYYIFKIIPFFKLKISLIRINVIREIYKFSFAVFYMQLLGYLSYQLDNILIGRYMKMQDITNYTVSTKTNQILERGLSLITTIIMPTMFKADATKNYDLIEKMVNKGTKYYAILATPLAFVGIIFINSFIKLWVGNTFLPYAIWGVIYLSGYIFDPAMGIVSTTIFSLGHHKVITIIRSLSTLINVILSIYLIKYFGIGGPILGTVITGSFLNIPTYPYFCKLLNVNWRKSFIAMYKVVLLNIPSFSILFLIFNYIFEINSWLNLFAGVSVSLLIFYIPLIFVFIEQEEKKDVNNLISKIFGRNIYLFNIR